MNPKKVSRACNISHLLVQLTDTLVGLMSARDIPLRAERFIPVAARVRLVKSFVNPLFVKFAVFEILSDYLRIFRNF